jgi:hypothetical protein
MKEIAFINNKSVGIENPTIFINYSNELHEAKASLKS